MPKSWGSASRLSSNPMFEPCLACMQKTCYLWLAFICLFFNPSLDATYFDSPPPGWQCLEDSAQLPQRVHVLYVGKGTTRFAPTIHLSSEEISQSLEEYMLSARHYHERSPEAHCHDLGQVATQSGVARLIQIDSPSVYGQAHLLQAYILHEGEAFVITGTALKEDFNAFSPVFYETVRSFHLVSEKNRLRTKSRTE